MSKRNKGIICILFAAFFFSLMSVTSRLAGDLPTAEKIIFRNAVAGLVSFVMLKRAKVEFFRYVKSDFKDLMARALFGTLGITCNFYAIDRLAVSDSNMLNKLSPFFSILLSIFILKEVAKKRDWLCVIIAFIGALLVIKPGMSLTSFPAFIGLVGGFGAGAAYTFVRKMGKRGVPGPVIVFFFSVVSTIIAIPMFIISFQPMSVFQLCCLIGCGVSAAGGQIAVTAAYTFAPAKEISVYDYVQVIFAALWGFFLFDQIPDVYSVIGYVIIIGAALERFLRNRKED